MIGEERLSALSALRAFSAFGAFRLHYCRPDGARMQLIVAAESLPDDQLPPHPAVHDVCAIGISPRRWVSGSAHASSEYPDLVRFDEAFPSTGSGEVKRREIAREVARDHPAILMMTP